MLLQNIAHQLVATVLLPIDVTRVKLLIVLGRGDDGATDVADCLGTLNYALCLQ